MTAVSVLLPVRNARTTLAACLDSIARQTLSDFEVIAVDDHCDDGTRQLLDHAARADPRIRVIDNEGDGLVDALNTGLEHARSELVARMDADDLMHARRLALQQAAMQADPDIVVLGSRVEQFPVVTDGAREYLRWQNACCTPARIRADLYVESPFAHPSVMLRRSVVVASGGYRAGDFPEDYELWLRLAHLGHRMQKLQQTLLLWRDTPTRLSRNDPRYRRGAFDRLRAAYLARDDRFLRHAERFVICGAGRRTRQRCGELLRLGFRPSAWVDIDPRKIGNRLEGVPVVAPSWLVANPLFALGYVAAHGARETLAAELTGFGYRRGEDFLLVG